jgi:hypothetical protein
VLLRCRVSGTTTSSACVRYEVRHSTSWEENLMAGSPRLIEPDLGSGASRELDGKLGAPHSSASLVVNSFEPVAHCPGCLKERTHLRRRNENGRLQMLRQTHPSHLLWSESFRHVDRDLELGVSSFSQRISCEFNGKGWYDAIVL